MIWVVVAKAFGFMWKYRQPILIIILAASFFGLWQHSQDQAAALEKSKADITTLKTVIYEYENAQRELDGKVQYEKENANAAADSAAAVAAGRLNGDGSMAPVLRTEYDRVRRLAKERGAR